MPRKADIRSAAALLGSLGGRRNTEAQQQARRQNGAHGGRRPSYRLVSGELHRRIGERWTVLEPPYDPPAKAFLRRNR